MTPIGWIIIVALAAGLVGGLFLWARHGSKGGHDT
jgi:hypothetical protein